MMLIGLSASADTIVQNQLTANWRASEHARQAAHAALEWAESWVLELDLPSPEACVDMCSPDYFQTNGSLSAHPEHEPLSWWLENGFVTGSQPQNVDVPLLPGHFGGKQSLWLIQPVHQLAASADGTTGPRAWYRVLSRGSGEKDAVVSVMESTVIRTWPTRDQTDATGIDASGWCAANTDLCGRVTWRERR